MKKIIYKISLLVAAVVITTSCEDKLDQLPFDDFGTDGAFNTASDFENGIRGVYETLTDAGYYGSSDAGSLLSAPDVMADNVTISTQGRGTKSTIHNWLYNPSSANLSNLYTDAYQLIYRANQVLFFAEGFDGANKENIVAEARALRGMAHFDLVRTFGKIPTQSGDANGSLGVAYVQEKNNDIQPARISVGETYSLIIADLQAAAAGINESNPEGRLGKDAVNLLLSRVYLYMGQWQNSFDAANLVTKSVAARNRVVGVWEDGNKDGVIFLIPNSAGGLNNSIGVTWSQGSLTSLTPEYVVSLEFFQKFADDDIRKEAYTAPGKAGGKDVNAIKKLLFKANGPGSDDDGPTGVVDYKIFRAAEIQLNKAEALFNLGNESGALAALNQVRSKRYTTPPNGEAGVALRDAIRLERRFEFAFEYQRFYDLKRWGLGVTRTNSGDFADGTGTPSERLTLPAGDFKFQLPIDLTSLDKNPNMVQNPGY